MKKSIGALLLVALVGLSLPSCKDDKALSSSGVKECDDYVAALEACINTMPEKERAPWKKELDNTRNSLKQASGAQRKQLAGSCRTGTATLRSSGLCKKK